MAIHFLTIIFFLISPLLLMAQTTVSVKGNWQELIDDADLMGDAGSPLNDIHESAANEVNIDIKGDKTLANWTVYVKRIDNTWSSDFVLSARRTGNGGGKGSIANGETYQEITTTNVLFFNGYLKRNNVPVQFKLNLLTDILDQGVYDTTIVYTITEP